MIAPGIIREEWQQLKAKNDRVKIAAIANVSTDTIDRGMRGESCTAEVFAAISSFYKERKKLVNQE